MSLRDLLAEKRELLVDHMMSMRNTEMEPGEADTLQFIRGFVDLVERAAHGDHSAMKNYLETVVPGIKAAEMPLVDVMDGMVRVAMTYTAMLPEEHHKWAVDFNAAYTRKLLEMWEAA